MTTPPIARLDPSEDAPLDFPVAVEDGCAEEEDTEAAFAVGAAVCNRCYD